mmetsp:Transcript_18539/g.27954  ORF Transcript_18539/g.27954 Transcript_18539/m.27954 type:complete len:118 (-) Transcript_18539:595-948(-)
MIICVHFHKDIIFPHKMITTKKIDPILFLLCLKFLHSRFELAETEFTHYPIFRYSKDAIDQTKPLSGSHGSFRQYQLNLCLLSREEFSAPWKVQTEEKLRLGNNCVWGANRAQIDII